MPERPKSGATLPRCPECNSGKCVNCSTQTLDVDDQWVLCACPKCSGGLKAWGRWGITD